MSAMHGNGMCSKVSLFSASISTVSFGFIFHYTVDYGESIRLFLRRLVHLKRDIWFKEPCSEDVPWVSTRTHVDESMQ